MAINQLDLEGVSVNKIYTDLISGGVSSTDAAVLVGSWIFQNFGKAKRVFDYRQTFPAADPACAAQFQRSFTHQDWVDGESVVQAQQTPGEEGFNIRFHEIESDLDAVRADLVKAFACLAEMRAGLRALLDEIRAEINRLNNDVFQCCKDKAPPAGVAGGFATLVESANFVGVTRFAEKAVSVWKTDKGIMVLPAVNTVGVDVVTEPRVRRGAELARLFQENAAIREGMGGQGFTKRALVERFGSEKTREGRTLGELLQIVPDEASFPSLDALENDVIDREAAALRTTSGADASIAAAFGLQTEIEKVSEAPVEKLLTIPANVRSVLLRRGVASVGKLADASPREIAGILKSEGIEATTADAAEWTATAKTLAKSR